MIKNYMGIKNGRKWHKQVEFLNGMVFMRFKTRRC